MTEHIHNDDSRLWLDTLDAESFAACVTDPPYELGFMGKDWDKRGIASDPDFWRKVFRVLKPGAHLAAFGGTRTYHRITCAIEDAGFEIRDCLMWTYGQGFPKSHNVSKAIDKRGGAPHLSAEIGRALKSARMKRGLSASACDKQFCGGTTNWSWFEGRTTGQRAPTPETFAAITEAWPELVPLAAMVAEAERVVVGQSLHKSGIGNAADGHYTVGGTKAEHVDITANATPEAQAWDGWGTALKPAWEPIILARKPFKGSVAENVLKRGTGAVNVGACKIGTSDALTGSGSPPLKFGGSNSRPFHENWKAGNARDGEASAEKRYGERGATNMSARPGPRGGSASGRWPANVILQHAPECVCVGTREVKTGTTVTKGRTPDYDASSYKVVDTRKENGGYGGDDRSETTDLWACVPGCPVRTMDEQSGKIPSSFRKASRGNDLPFGDATGVYEGANLGYTDAGGASRFFFNAKASTAERSAGLPGGERNLHPTVKPIEVMRWLARLLTPPGGTILEPFCGSGTTACACELEGFDYEACEKDKGHVRTSRLRAIHWRGVAEKAALEEANRTPLLDMLEAGQRKE